MPRLAKMLEGEGRRLMTEWLSNRGYVPSKSGYGPSMERAVDRGWVRIVLSIGDDRYTRGRCPIVLMLEARDERRVRLDALFGIPASPTHPDRIPTHAFSPSVVLEGRFRPGSEHATSPEDLARAFDRLRQLEGNALVSRMETWTSASDFVSIDLAQRRTESAPFNLAVLSMVARDEGDAALANYYAARARTCAAESVNARAAESEAVERILALSLPPRASDAR